MPHRSSRPALWVSAPLLLVLGGPGCAPRGGGDDDDDAVASNVVLLQTRFGEAQITLFPDDAPITTANFLAYLDSGFYDGGDGLGATVFHRVIADFVAQGGGLTEAGSEKATGDPIVNEASDSGLSNVRGTLAMARTSDPDSATSQFFVNLVHNLFLDPGESTPDGYTVFGEVTQGMDVIDALGVTATNADDAPLDPVIITSMLRQP